MKSDCRNTEDLIVSEKIKPILISFRKNEREKKLSEYTRNKPCYIGWIKEAMFEKMDREAKMNNSQQRPIRNTTKIPFREDVM